MFVDEREILYGAALHDTAFRSRGGLGVVSLARVQQPAKPYVRSLSA